MLTGRTGLSPRLVGRAGPLAQLSGLVSAASLGKSDRAAVALVAGDAGVGKTRLLQELASNVPAGTVVLAGQAEPGALGRPWELVQELLGGELPPAVGGDQRLAVVEAIESKIDATPSLVVFEDLHWADGESVAVFDRLAASGPPTLVLVGTYRPDELSHRLPGGDLLARLERRQSVRQVRLEPLSRPETASLLAAIAGHALPARVVAALHARTGGNPFFLEELVVAAGDADPASLVDQPLPWSLTELVQRQLDGLSPAERRLAEAAAVLGRSAEFDLLAGMTAASEDDLIDQLRTLVDRGLLVEECEDEFSFRHALVRDAVEGQLLGRERRRLHERALSAMQQACCGDLAELARHARGAGRYDEFVELARRGAEHYLSRGSTHQALQLAAEALTEEPDDITLLAIAAKTSWMIGLSDEAVGHGERWLRLARLAGDVEQEAAALCLLGRAQHDAGRTEKMWEVVSAIEGLVEQMAPGEARARALAFVSQANMLQGKVEPALAYADRAIAEAERADAKGVRAQALVERASTLLGVPDRVLEGLEALRAAVPEAEAAGDWVLVTRALNNLAQALPVGGEESAELADRMRDIADRVGFDANLSYYAIHEAERALFLADEPQLQAELLRIRDLAAINTRLLRSWPAALQASLLIEQGNIAEAAEVVEGLCVQNPEMPEWVVLQVLEVASHQGDRGEAERCRLRLLAAPEGGYGVSGYAAVNWLLEVLEAGYRLGWARSEVEPLVAARRRLIGPIEHLHDLVDAVVELWWGTAGADRVVELVSDPRVDGEVARLTIADLRLSAARSFAAASRKADAREQAQIARTLLERWPGRRRDETDALLRRLDATTDQDAELTPREQEVAALLAEGLSNAEVAKRLYISPKTAAVHVSNILMKLGMANRAEVAAWAVRTGLAGEAPQAG